MSCCSDPVPTNPIPDGLVPLRYVGRAQAPVTYSVGRNRYQGGQMAGFRYIWAPPQDASVLAGMGFWETIPMPPQPKLSVLIPTLFRPEGLTTAIESAQATSQSQVEIVVAVDPEDGQAKAITKAHGGIFVEAPRTGPAAGWNLAMQISTGNVCVFAADDVLFHPGWYEETLTALKFYPDYDCLLGYNDLAGTPGQQWSTHFAFTKRFVDQHMGGQIAIEHYHSWYHDVEACTIAQQVGVYRHLAAAIVEHRHPQAGKAKMDATYVQGFNLHAERDEYIFKARKKVGFPQDYPSYLRSDSMHLAPKNWAMGFVQKPRPGDLKPGPTVNQIAQAVMIEITPGDPRVEEVAPVLRELTPDEKKRLRRQARRQAAKQEETTDATA